MNALGIGASRQAARAVFHGGGRCLGTDSTAVLAPVAVHLARAPVVALRTAPASPVWKACGVPPTFGAALLVAAQ